MKKNIDFSVALDISLCTIDFHSKESRSWKSNNLGTINEDSASPNTTHCSTRFIESVVTSMLNSGMKGTVDGLDAMIDENRNLVLIQQGERYLHAKGHDNQTIQDRIDQIIDRIDYNPAGWRTFAEGYIEGNGIPDLS